MPRHPLPWIAGALLATLSLARAQDAPAPSPALTLAPVFGDGMVLPAGVSVPVWGRAAPGASVQVSFGDATATATAAPDGRWRCEIPARKASRSPEPLTVSAAGGATLRRSDVLVGEVWLCSGQSNMEWPLSRSDGGTDEYEGNEALPIRLLRVAHATSDRPLDSFEGAWGAPRGRNISEWSAVAWHFGRALHAELDVPIGLIQSTWGGTPAEAWTRGEALAADPQFAAIVERGKAESKSPQNQASRLWNAMMAPLAGFPVRGVIWYQGESNVGQAWQYRALFPAMIRDWRAQWGRADLPFYFVQIAPWRYPKEWSPEGTGAAELREAQALATTELSNTAMVPTMDIGNPTDIHPGDKRTVGERLARVALHRIYKRGSDFLPPAYAGFEPRGDAIVVSFSGAGLKTKDGKAATGFQIAGADRKFVDAEARIEGSTVVVRSASVKDPVAVRFGWTDAAQPNLVGVDDLPALPLRTDSWPVSTQPAPPAPAK